MKRTSLNIKTPDDPYNHYSIGYKFIAKKMEKIVKTVESGTGQVFFQTQDSEEPTASNINKLFKEQEAKFNIDRAEEELYILNHRFFTIAAIHYLHEYYTTNDQVNLEQALKYCQTAVQLEPENQQLKELQKEIGAAKNHNPSELTIRQKLYAYHKKGAIYDFINLYCSTTRLLFPIQVKVLAEVVKNLSESPDNKNKEEETEGEEETTKKRKENPLQEHYRTKLYGRIDQIFKQLAIQFVTAYLSGHTTPALVNLKMQGLLRKLSRADNIVSLRFYNTIALAICNAAFSSNNEEKSNYLLATALNFYAKDPRTKSEIYITMIYNMGDLTPRKIAQKTNWLKSQSKELLPIFVHLLLNDHKHLYCQIRQNDIQILRKNGSKIFEQSNEGPIITSNILTLMADDLATLSENGVRNIADFTIWLARNSFSPSNFLQLLKNKNPNAYIGVVHLKFRRLEKVIPDILKQLVGCIAAQKNKDGYTYASTRWINKNHPKRLPQFLDLLQKHDHELYTKNIMDSIHCGRRKIIDNDHFALRAINVILLLLDYTHSKDKKDGEEYSQYSSALKQSIGYMASKIEVFKSALAIKNITEKRFNNWVNNIEHYDGKPSTVLGKLGIYSGYTKSVAADMLIQAITEAKKAADEDVYRQGGVKPKTLGVGQIQEGMQ